MAAGKAQRPSVRRGCNLFLFNYAGYGFLLRHLESRIKASKL